MDTKQIIVKKGCLHRYSNRDPRGVTGVDKFYVLYGSTEKNAARLDWYDSEDSFTRDPSVRKSLFIEEVIKVDRLPASPATRQVYGNDAKYLIAIQTSRTDTEDVLRAGSESVLKEWIQVLQKLVDAARYQSLKSRTTVSDKLNPDQVYQPKLFSALSFDVEVDDTAAANRCELYSRYQLVLSTTHVTLVDVKLGVPVLSWLYKHVRRYGFSESSFTLEAGHKAGPAEGVFIFKNCSGGKIREAMESQMTAIAESQKDTTYAYAMLPSPETNPNELSPTNPKPKDMSPTNPKPKALAISTKTNVPNKSKPPVPAQKAAKKPSFEHATTSKTPTTNTVVNDNEPIFDVVDGVPINDVINGKSSSPPAGYKPKMSEISGMLAKQKMSAATDVAKPTESDLYAHIDLQNMPSSQRGKMAASDTDMNLYGEQLQRQELHVEEEATYAEIGFDGGHK